MVEALPPVLELMSVHVPKCGGVSLRSVLHEIFGQALLLDYDDHVTDPASPCNADRKAWSIQTQNGLPKLLAGKRAVHGHFHAKKYMSIPASFRTAIIREPIARLLSHFYYWQAMPPGVNSLHRYFLEHQLDLESFAQLPTVRNFYTHVYFGEIKLADFDFIGAFEEMPKAIARIGQGIGQTLDIGFENRNESLKYKQALEALLTDTARYRKLAELLTDDIRFYEDCRVKWG